MENIRKNFLTSHYPDDKVLLIMYLIVLIDSIMWSDKDRVLYLG